MVLLQVIDRKWREHLYEMDYLQEGISLRAYAQRDPVVEYQREGFSMFATMMDGIKEETVGFLYNVEVQVQQPQEAPQDDTVPVAPKGLSRAPRSDGLRYSAPTIDGEAGSGGVAVERPAPEQQAPALGVGRGNSVLGPAGSAASAQRPAPGQSVSSDGPSRNAPCPCGSGRKYKRCHGAPGGA
jgi:preprotein translocase subunit SecA